MITVYFISGVLLIVALIIFAMWCCYRAGCDDGYERGRADAFGRKLAEDRAQRGRHARSQPRVSAPSPVPAPAAADSSSGDQPSHTSLVRSGYRDSWFTRGGTPRPGRVRLPRGGAIGVFLEQQAGRAPVTARDIEQVLLPPAPAPDLNGAADTGTMPKVELAVGDTGEMVKLTDKWISEHIRSEAIA